MLHSIGDWERISDYARDLNQSAREIRDKKLVISAEAQNSYERISDHCSNIAIVLMELADNALDVHQMSDLLQHEHQFHFETYFDEYAAVYLKKADRSLTE